MKSVFYTIKKTLVNQLIFKTTLTSLKSDLNIYKNKHDYAKEKWQKIRTRVKKLFG